MLGLEDGARCNGNTQTSFYSYLSYSFSQISTPSYTHSIHRFLAPSLSSHAYKCEFVEKNKSNFILKTGAERQFILILIGMCVCMYMCVCLCVCIRKWLSSNQQIRQTSCTVKTTLEILSQNISTTSSFSSSVRTVALSLVEHQMKQVNCVQGPKQMNKQLIFKHQNHRHTM